MERIWKADISLMVVLFLFVLFGVIMVYSASYPIAYIQFDNANHYFNRQMIWACISFLLFFLALFTPYRVYGKLSPFLVMITILMLILVLIPGVGIERNFSRRWLSLGGFLFQPVEIAKLTMIIYFAYFYKQKASLIYHFRKGVVPPLIILAIVFGFILLQPDLGSATLILASCGLLLFFTKIRYMHLFMLVCIAIAGFSAFAMAAPYRIERISGFLDPFHDMQGTGYQLVHSYISIQSGGLTGNGIGASVQKLGYLPESHTDFIMAIIAEEFGFLGILLVIGFYFFLFVKGIRIANRTEDKFGYLLAIGITLQLIIQAFINLGAVTGLLPITGITLPFLSYGGSSLLISVLSMGILLNISTYSRKKAI